MGQWIQENLIRNVVFCVSINVQDKIIVSKEKALTLVWYYFISFWYYSLYYSLLQVVLNRLISRS